MHGVARSFPISTAPPAAWLRVCALCWGLLCGHGKVACADDRRIAANPDAEVGFDIGPQSLPQALDAFSVATGIEVLVDARNAEGRRSQGVRGRMTARQALKILLTGAPLVAEELSPETVALMRLEPPALPRPKAGPPYFTVIQRAVLRALCQLDDTAPGGYRLALRLQIGPDGAVARWRLLDTTGDDDRDRAIGAALSGLRIGESPPADLPQPVAVVVLPRVSPDCVATPAKAR